MGLSFVHLALGTDVPGFHSYRELKEAGGEYKIGGACSMTCFYPDGTNNSPISASSHWAIVCARKAGYSIRNGINHCRIIKQFGLFIIRLYIS